MKKIITISIFIIITLNIQSQSGPVIQNIPIGGGSPDYKEYIPNVFPPSPSAFKFSTYGNVPMNGSTGAFSYSIPLFTVNEKDIIMPISIDYSSNGVRIDALSGLVGTDWNLNAGGIISRVIRGYPDESTERWYPTYINPDTDNIKQKIYAIANNNTVVDTEQDWFSFNVNGISGNFYFDKDLNILVNSKEYVKITMTSGSSGSYGPIMTFTITDNRGYQYVFGGDDNYLESSIAGSTNSIGPKSKYYSSWFLKKIISPNQNTIDFTYVDNRFDYKAGVSFSLVYDQDCVCGGVNVDSYKSIYTDNVSNILTNSRAISEIKFSNGSIKFNYNADRLDNGGLSLAEILYKNQNSVVKKVLFGYDTVRKIESHPYDKLSSDASLQYRMFLNNIQFADSQDKVSERYSFEYYNKEQLPIRLSFSKDIYGYNNGSSNSSPFSSKLLTENVISDLIKRYRDELYVSANLEVNPGQVYYGMLSKITYPTKGYTKIEYEANATTQRNARTVYEHEALEILKDCSSGAVNSQTFTFTATAKANIKYNVGANLYEIPGCMEPTPDALHDKYYFTIYDLTANRLLLSQNKPFGTIISNEDIYAPQVETEIGHMYEITLELLSKKFNTSSGGAIIEYNPRTVYSEGPLYAGGARVKTIEDFDSENKPYNKKSYYYNKLSLYPTQESTLVDIFAPRYYYSMGYNKNCVSACEGNTSDPSRMYLRYIISSSSYSALYNNRKQVSYYTTITEFTEKSGVSNGATERFYNEIEDSQSNPIWGPIIIEAPYTNGSDAYYGLLTEENIYKKMPDKYMLVQKKKLNYSIKNNSTNLSSYIIRKNYDPIAGVVQPGEYGTDIEHVSIALYYNYWGFAKLANVVDSLYYDGTNIATTTSSSYGTSPYYNLVIQNTSSSNGDVVTNKYQYASDLVGQLTNMDKLVSSNIIGVPIIKEARIKKSAETADKLLSQIKTTYKQVQKQKNGITVNMLLPEFVYTLHGSTPTSNGEKRISYNIYNENGNLVEYNINDKDVIVYLWSYNGQYPIAEIKNASYSQVTAAINEATLNSISLKNEPTESDWTLINSLRTRLPSAHITTYTYKSLVGIQTFTDPAGVTTYYEYDTFNRLKRTYIKEKNISGVEVEKTIQSNEYHYQNQ